MANTHTNTVENNHCAFDSNSNPNTQPHGPHVLDRNTCHLSHRHLARAPDCHCTGPRHRLCAWYGHGKYADDT